MGDPIGIASVLVKWGLYVGVLLGAGSVFCAVLFRVDIRGGLIAGAAAIGASCAIMSFALKGSVLTGDLSGALDSEMLGLLWQTQSGVAFRWQIGGLALMLVGLLWLRLGWVLRLLGGVMALYGLSAIGHVYDQSAPVLRYILLLHLISAALWVGILVPLHSLASDPDTAQATARLGARFGQIAMLFVPVLLIAGGYLAYGLTGSVTALFTTSYGQVLLTKVALVVLLLLLAAMNKLRFIPGLQAGNPDAARGLARTIRVEGALMAAILLATAILTTSLTPPHLH